MKPIEKNESSIAFCGLYCGACKAFLNERCPGCHDNVKAKWCKVRTCNLNHDYKSCADCVEYPNPMDCRVYNNFISKLMGVVFRSDRNACLAFIKDKGYENFAQYMTENRIMTFKK